MANVGHERAGVGDDERRRADQTFPPTVRNAGVLGIPGTQVLYGDGDILATTRSGGRFIFGLPLDYEQRCRLKASFLD